MKKLFALLAVVLAVVSCQRDADDLNVAMGGEQEVMLTVSLPEATRADSTQGGLSNIDKSKFTLRYILEIYRVEGEQVLYNTCQRFVEPSDNTSMVFPVRLAPGYDYRIVAWTDIVEGDSKEDRYYYTEEGLDNVVIKDNGTVNWNPMDETRDAYTGTQLVENFNSTTNIPNMTLTRPFAKVRVVATDIEDIRNVGLEPTTATVEYAQDMYVKYNAVEDMCIADGAKKKTHEYTYTTTASKYEDDDNDGELTLFTDYIFVPALRTAKFTLNVYADANKSMLIKGNNFNTDIFVERNKLTTIKGDVLTTGGNINVTVDNDLGVKETYNIVDTAESLQEVIKNAEDNTSVNIELGGDIDLGAIAGILSTRAGENAGLVIPANKTVVLDLKGYNLTYTSDIQGNSMILNNGDLTIKGTTGKISYKFTGEPDSSFSKGNQTINNCGLLTIEASVENTTEKMSHANYVINTNAGATLVVNDGASIVSKNTQAVRMVSFGSEANSMTVNGGYIEGTRAIQLHLPGGNSSANAKPMDLTINGGELKTFEETYNLAIYAMSNGESAAETKITINDGTFNGNFMINAAMTNTMAANAIEINGGAFNGKYGVYSYSENAEKKAETITIKGGTFSTLSSIVYLAENCTYTLNSNVDDAETVEFYGKGTLDLNGKTVTTAFAENSETNHQYAINNHGELTIKDSSEYGKGEIFARGNFNYGKMTLESGTIYAFDCNGGYGIRNYEGAEFVMNGGAIIANNEEDHQVNEGGYDATTLRVDEGATATINSGIINNISDYTFAIENHGTTTVNDGTVTSVHTTVANYGTITLNGGSFTCNGLEGITAHALWAAEGKTTINGGTFDGKDNYNGFNVDASEGATVYIKGGKFLPVHSGSLYGEGTIEVTDGEFFDDPSARVAEGYKAVKGENGYWTIANDPAAQIGSTEYATLQEAIEAVEDGETIVLQRDVNITTPAYGQNALNHAKAVNFTLDLNGKTISADTGNSVFRYNISQTDATSNITVTFKNGTITSGDNTWCTVMAAGTSNDVKAIFNLENLTINASKAGDLAVKAWDYAVINAKNVTVNATKCAGGFYALGGEIVLDNCTVNQKGLHTAPYLSMALAVSNMGKMTVKSGNYTTEPTAAAEGGNQGTSHGSWCAGVMNTGGDLIINGGTFANGNFGDDALATAARGLIFGDTASKIVINDGTFNALKTVIDYQNNLGVQPNPNIVINGGNFSANPAIVTSYGGVVLAEGKVAAQGADGRWTLVDGVVDEAGLKAAFEQGGNIVLGADITVAEPVVLAEGKTAVLNLNGKTLAAADEQATYAINNHGTLTIKGNGIVNARGMYNGYDANDNYVTTAKLTIENGTFNAKGTNGGACVFNYGTVDINGGTFTSIGGYSLNNQASGSMNIYSATVTGGIYNVGVSLVVNDGNIQTVRAGYTHAIYHNGTSLVINGGTFMGNGNEVVNANSAVATINGGTFTKDPNGQTSYLMAGANMTINNGTFNAHASNPAGHPVRPDVIVKGGTFNYKHSNIAAGYKIVDNGNGTWTVVAE